MIRMIRMKPDIIGGCSMVTHHSFFSLLYKPLHEIDSDITLDRRPPANDRAKQRCGPAQCQLHIRAQRIRG